MTETGYAAGFIVRMVVTLVFLGAAAAAIRYGWTAADRRRKNRGQIPPSA